MVNPSLALRKLQNETNQTDVTPQGFVADIPCAFPPQTECFKHININLGQPLVVDELSQDIQPVSVTFYLSFVARTDGQERLLVMDQKRSRSGLKCPTRDRDTLFHAFSQTEEPPFRGLLGVGQVWGPRRFLD